MQPRGVIYSVHQGVSVPTWRRERIPHLDRLAVDHVLVLPADDHLKRRGVGERANSRDKSVKSQSSFLVQINEQVRSKDNGTAVLWEVWRMIPTTQCAWMEVTGGPVC
jgi:hypothetical protein